MSDEKVVSLKDKRASEPRVDKKLVDEALDIYKKYKEGKANLEKRIIENDQWYRLRYNQDSKKSTAWLFNSIANKHADAMDSLPEVSVLPREESDKEAAETLSQVLPVILERNNFEIKYSNIWWRKLKCGTGAYGIFWNKELMNGLGDVDIQEIDILSLYWEPGVIDIQNSANVFYVKLQDNKFLESKYPQLAGKLGEGSVQVSHYIHDDTIDTKDKTPVVDWYYKRQNENKTTVHYCKICNGELLYSSENDPKYAERGFYDHGEYPFVLDPLYPEEESPCGFGLIDIMKGSQGQIDELDEAILKNAKRAAKTRYFINSSGAVNEEEFADWNKDFVHVSGSNLGEDSIRNISTPTLGGIYLNIRNMKVEELKETSGNRDFSQGATANGVTAASAIAALQEAGGKLSRDMIKGAYFAFKNVNGQVIEIIRQFYEMTRFFRITSTNGEDKFVAFDNSGIKLQEQTKAVGDGISQRLPVFDLDVKASKNTAYSKLSQNELAIQLYGMGVFNPENATVAHTLVSAMDFNGKNEMLKTIRSNGTLLEKLQAIAPITIKLASAIDNIKQTGGAFTQEVIAILGQAPGGETPNVIEPEVDNSLEAKSRRRSNEATVPK